MDHTENKSPQEGSKKTPFDELTRDELISKCKGLLVLAQKARYSKQELQNEIDSYKIKEEEYEKEKKLNAENLRTLQEVADSLTEQKLNYITDLESALNKIKTLNHKCSSYEDEINNFKAEIIVKEKNSEELLIKISNLDSENISLKRQNNRLVEENEQLLNQLSELEARTEEFNNIGLEQRAQLKILEEQIQSEAVYKAKIEELNNKIGGLENDLKNSKSENNFKEQLDYYENKIKELTQLYENEKSNQEKSNIKLRSYRDKISKCAACINQLKNSRFILSKTVKEYSVNIPKWQNDIIAASVVLDGQLKKLSQENNNLKEKVTNLEEQIKQFESKNKANSEVELEAEIQLLRNQVLDLQKSNDDLAHKNYKLSEDIHKLKTSSHKDNSGISQEMEETKKLLKLQIDEITEKHDVLFQNNMEMQITMENLRIKNNELHELSQCSKSENHDVEKLELQIKALESEKSILVKEKLNAKDNALELEGMNNVLTNKLNKMQSDHKHMSLKIDELRRENEVLQNNIMMEKEEQVNKLKFQIATLQEEYDVLKKEHESMVDMNGLLKEEVETLKLSLEQPKDESDNMSDLNVSLQADVVKLETKLSAYKQENSSLLAELKESRTKIKEYDNIVAEYEDAKVKLSSYKTENTELLNEMKEINQVLKERGESISKLQKAIGEMERLIDTLEKDRDDSNQEKENLRKSLGILESDLSNVKLQIIDTSQKAQVEKDNVIQSLTEKENIISSLKDELFKLRQQYSCSATDLTNEDMSTSTISKAEEHSRMRDLDETFEEKYGKLRIFALKLKKKLNETTIQLQNTEKDKERLAKLLGDANKIVPAASNDVVDGDQKENEEIVNQTAIFDLETKVQNLKETVKSTENIVKEFEAAKTELSNVNQRLSAEIEAHKATKDSLEKARRDVKKKNVLSLEMEDYERSMKELTTKMEEKVKKIVQMESTIDTQEGTIASMKVQINLLEEQIKAEETQNRLVREELQSANDEVKEKENVIQHKNNLISKLEQDLEDEKRKNEESNMETTSLLSEKEKTIICLGQEKAELNNKMKRIEFKCAELDDQLKLTKIELEDLKIEHSSYKVRAQAILRQNQTIDHSLEERLKEEAAAFKAHIETLDSKLATVQAERAEAAEEAAAARRRAGEAAAELARAQQRTARLHADLARLAQQLDAERTHHKLQVSTLTQCYKTQMAEMEGRLLKEMDELKNQLTIAQETAPILPGSSLDDDNRNPYVIPVIPKEDSDGEMDINVTMIPREEGEGSEAAPSPPPSKSYKVGSGGTRSPVPLERLLEEGVPEDESPGGDALEPDQEILDLRRKLLSQQQRVKHVTVLLAESERECARMAQLAELLKGELRRVRGAGAGAHNAEYMKNVTLKFLTLPPGDERSRLVPVLQKILSLTNDETNKVQAVAKAKYFIFGLCIPNFT
ncbi:hypothetical protein MSG28_000458 [Choristoneura fumiferana]|uniref:Uncharacterized protein n=1 Tax=Choristoneura fumiferana TaxID=7141 RepID=A0ACC0K0P3_CHOFU|nr:hypothetical protein MSG28_000458 [Choristoneura fumiferana]